MAVDDYATLTQLKAHFGESRSTFDTQLTVALDAAHRWVEHYTGRQFTLAGSATARKVTTYSLGRCLVPDVGSLTDLVVATDHDGDLDYDVTWDSDDYVALRYPDRTDYPYTLMHATGNRDFPAGLRKGVQVTAKWGWPSVPESVTAATLLQAAYLYERRKSPSGTLGSEAAGTFQFGGKGDPDARGLLRAFRRRYPF